MGVLGLTTFLREHQSTCAKPLLFTQNYNELTNLVIDGWSFVYELSDLSNLPWVYGGEYGPFSGLIERVVRNWLSVGVRLLFVFDGPCPATKFPTLISRITRSRIQASLLFFRTSSVSRSTPRFLAENSILPPFAASVCIATLQSIIQSLPDNQAQSPSLEIYFADEEGDPFAVELAARVGAYVVAQDSDYVILNAEGYKGYIPLQDMVWSGVLSDQGELANSDNDDGFQTVVNSKSRKKASALQTPGTGCRIIPPEDVADLQLSVMVYSPSALATHIQIPESLLPLLGSLVGNDFTRNKESSLTTHQVNLQWLFFDRKLTLSQRILRVAQTLRSILAAALSPAAKGKPKLQVGSVMELIEKAVIALTIRSTDHMASGERAKIIETVVESTLRYAIPRPSGENRSGRASLWLSDLCPLHEDTSCQLVKYFTAPLSSNEDDKISQSRLRVRQLYVSAYRAGKLGSRLLDVLNTGTLWSAPFLENPDLETVGRSIARPINAWCFSLLEDGIGLNDHEDDSESGSADGTTEEDEDELVDVVEDSDEDDPLAPLRGALQKLDHPGDAESESQAPSTTSRSRASRAAHKVVVEYVRRGTRVAAENVTVPALSDILASADIHHEFDIPYQLRSEEERFSLFLRCLESDTPKVRGLPHDQLLAALTLRWVVLRLAARAQESGGNKDRVKELWTKQEARALLASFPSSPLDDLPEEYPPITDRNIQLASQIVAAYKSIQQFAEILLLYGRVPGVINRFSGRLFHSYLTGTETIPRDALPAGLWDACVDNLEGAFAVVHKDRKDKRVANSPLPRKSDRNQGRNNGQKGAGGYGHFGLLAGLGD